MTDTIYSLINFLADLGGGGVDGIVFIIFLACCVLVGLGHFKMIPKSTASALMTSVGILGTFVGIFLALKPLDFAPDKMNDSIEALLNGMTTAFVTSLIGLAFSIASRAFWSINLERSPQTSPEHQDISGKLEDIKRAIAGDGDSSLVTQMQKLRDENREGFKKLDEKMEGLADAVGNALVNSLDNLIQEIRDIIANQLAASLENLISNIEEALINQFGKTFVEFNQGVQAIKKWQEDHKEQVEQLTDAFNQTRIGMQDISGSMRDIKDSTTQIPATVEKLGSLIRTMDEQITDLSERLEAFNKMKENAENALPVIESHLKQIGDDLAASVRGLDSFQETLTKVVEESKNTADRITRQCTKDMEDMFKNMRVQMEQAHNQAAEKIKADIEGHVVVINLEIDKVAQEWARNLVAVAQKCQETINAVNDRKQ